MSGLAGLGLLLVAVMACSAESTSEGACEYEPFGRGGPDWVTFTAERLGQFDVMVRVSVDGFEGDPNRDRTVSATVDDVVAGDIVVDETVRVSNRFNFCLEPGHDYYVIANLAPRGGIEVKHPWATFPVINNRITLHPDMRKDELIGQFHGLDPVLFKRRFVAYVSRTDIDVN